MSREKTSPLSAAQFDIMSVIWEQGEATITQVLKAINQDRKRKLRRTTIQVQMSRLEKKGWLTHQAEGRTFLYSALVEKDDALGFIAGDVTKRIFNGSCADLVKALFKNNKVSSKEIKRLRAVLDEVKEDEP
jgi:predicted transcriptional regulator